ncbi:hypothetical protein KI387_037057 [Taxus chinensis]|uniref:C3H1-type domain-containing protein n=1 Tax=Taxus chinensis TaxID=29808 RepID=A0AA38FRS8_TAXCH|nr:hypothetical protein KI387_037057 [Taxus chinensis]
MGCKTGQEDSLGQGHSYVHFKIWELSDFPLSTKIISSDLVIFTADLMGISENSELSLASISVGKHDWALGGPEVRRKNIFQGANDDFLIGKHVMATPKGKHFDLLYHHHTLSLPCYVHYEYGANNEDKVKGTKWTKSLPKAAPDHWQEGQQLKFSSSENKGSKGVISKCGVCTHESCPYRHVNVNPKAPICDGFLKGFCADNDKCKKKHTYICPRYALTGECSERSICKFHHPRRKIKPKLFSRVLKRNSKGRRYHFMTFEALGDIQSPSSVNLSAKEKKGPEEVSVENETAADYISLSASEEDITEDGMTEDNMGLSRRGNVFSFEQGLEADDSDMLLKPVLLLRQ